MTMTHHLWRCRVLKDISPCPFTLASTISVPFPDPLATAFMVRRQDGWIEISPFPGPTRRGICPSSLPGMPRTHGVLIFVNEIFWGQGMPLFLISIIAFWQIHEYELWKYHRPVEVLTSALEILVDVITQRKWRWMTIYSQNPNKLKYYRNCEAKTQGGLGPTKQAGHGNIFQKPIRKELRRCSHGLDRVLVQSSFLFSDGSWRK